MPVLYRFLVFSGLAVVTSGEDIAITFPEGGCDVTCRLLDGESMGVTEARNQAPDSLPGTRLACSALSMAFNSLACSVEDCPECR